jgi:hypothetical protein
MLLRLIGVIYTVMMILFMVGFYKTTPPVFQTFTFVVKVCMAIFLLFRFNPYIKKRTFTEVDREIILYSAYFILLSSFTDYVNIFLVRMQKFVTETTGEIMQRLYKLNIL